jgi:hypothetical protein
MRKIHLSTIHRQVVIEILRAGMVAIKGNCNRQLTTDTKLVYQQQESLDYEYSYCTGILLGTNVIQYKEETPEPVSTVEYSKMNSELLYSSNDVLEY